MKRVRQERESARWWRGCEGRGEVEASSPFVVVPSVVCPSPASTAVVSDLTEVEEEGSLSGREGSREGIVGDEGSRGVERRRGNQAVARRVVEGFDCACFEVRLVFEEGLEGSLSGREVGREGREGLEEGGG